MKLNIFALVVGTAIAGISIGSATASAENFVVEGSNNGVNKALNTNNNFSKIDGNPRMSIWDYSANDPDQQFDRIQGNRGGKLLQHRSTGKCMNLYYLSNGGAITTWPCDKNDPSQNFDITDVGGGYLQIRRTGTNFCVDSPNRNNGVQVLAWPCVNNSNQRFKNSVATIPNPPQPPSNNGGAYYRNFEGFINFAVGKNNITRLDKNAPVLTGQCVTLIARYIQEVYLTGSDRTKERSFSNGRATANTVASNFPNFFSPTTTQGVPNRGAIVSFPDMGYVKDSVKDGCPNNLCGHTAIVMKSEQLPNGQRRFWIMDSNGDGKAPNTQVKEYYWDWIDISTGFSTSGKYYGKNIYWTNPK